MSEPVACCDIHPGFPLQACVIEWTTPFWDRNRLECFACSFPGCARRYFAYFGCFEWPNGSTPDMGDFGAKPRCRKHETPLFMYLRRTDAGWQYACPDSKCSSTSPYSPEESEDC